MFIKTATALALVQLIAATAIGMRDTVRPPLIHLAIGQGVTVEDFKAFDPAAPTVPKAAATRSAEGWGSVLGLGASTNPAISWKVTTKQYGKADLLETCTIKLIDASKVQFEDRTFVIQAPTDGHVPITTSGPLVMACVARTA